MVKLYFDSRERVSGENETPVFQLKPTLDLKDDHSALLDSVCIPNTFRTISSSNDRFFIEEALGASSAYRVLSLPPGNYSVVSLATAIQTALNGSGSILGGAYTCTYNPTTNRLQFSHPFPSAGSFKLWEKGLLQTTFGLQLWNTGGGPQLSADLNDCLTIIGAVGDGTPSVITANTILTPSGAPNLVQHHNVFIHSPDFATSGQVYGPRNQTGIVRRVIMDTAAGAIQVDRHGTSFDMLRIPASTISTLSFELRAFDGSLVDLHGAPWSFSICMYPE
jgi:hypothetical protein